MKYTPTPFPEAIQRAIVGVVKNRPYLAPLAFSLTPIKVETDQPEFSFAVDARARLYFREEAVASYSTHELMFILYHEILHLLLNHFDRAEPVKGVYPHELINLAQDAEINHLLSSESFCSMPANCVTAQKMGWKEGKVFEEYLLQTQVKKISISIGPPPKDGKPSFGQQATRKGNSITLTPGTGDAMDSPQEGDGKEDLPAGITQARARQIELAVAELLKQEERGSTPGFMERWVEAFQDPYVPWQSVLRAWVTRSCAALRGWRAQTYRKPHRRSDSLQPFLLPSYYDSPLNLCLVLDTSGSMGSAELESQMAEVKAILRATHYPLAVIACDTDAAPVQRVFSESQVTLTGGGGTDMGVGIAAAQELRPRPDLLLIFSDCYTPWPAEHPGIPTLIIRIHSEEATPAWANGVIDIPEGK